MYYVFWPMAAIIMCAELLQSYFLLFAVPPYTGQCLHIGSVLYRYIVYVMFLCYEQGPDFNANTYFFLATKCMPI
jgi:hypothetical protein